MKNFTQLVQMDYQNKSNGGEERRFTDDRSQLDIELQKQTADVSITEMMQEADNMQVALSSKEPRMEENSIGEGNDGK